MLYPEPKSTFHNLSQTVTTPHCIEVKDSTSGNYLTISYFKNIGWEVEARYDKSNKHAFRQPYTGMQDENQRESIAVAENQDVYVLHAANSQLTLSKKTAQFVIEEDGVEVFKSFQAPFSSHKKEVSIYERLMSLKVTDFSERAPFVAKGTKLKTHMVRFQYPKPAGVVLGLPGTPGEINRSGYRYELYNTDDYVHIPGKALYQSWPILFHKAKDDKGWICLFHDNPSRTFVDVGDFYKDTVTFESVTGNSRVYVLSGKSLSEVSQKLAKLIGVTALPPLWAFGYQQCRWSYMSTHELRSVISRMQEESFPLDAIYCDIDYMDRCKVFTLNKERFGDLAQFINEAKEKGVRTICIMDPGIKIEQSYEFYQELKKSGAYLKKKNGEGLIGVVWPGKVLFPDFGDENMQQLWIDQEKKWLETFPVDGVWNDMNEPSNFRGGNAVIAKGYTSRGSLRNDYNLYGYFMVKASRMGWDLQNPNKRGLIISRSGYPGLQQYGIVWHGDNTAWWEHLRLALETTLLYSLCGVHYNGADVPGYIGNAPDDLAVRFFQLGAFMPLFRGHSIYFAEDKEPYAYQDPVRQIIKEALHLRYSLLREWYSGFEQAVAKKESPYQPVFTAAGDLVRDEVLLFNKFLIAPVVERTQQKKLIYLPEGNWYRFEKTEEMLSGDTWITEDIDLKSLPLFVRAGSIIVRNTVGKNTEDTLGKQEWYEIYKDEKGEARGYWYDDDHISLAKNGAKRYMLTAKNGKVIKETTFRQ